MVDEEYLNFDELFGFENPWVLLGNVDRTNIIFLSIFMIIGIPANFLIIIISAWSSFSYFFNTLRLFSIHSGFFNTLSFLNTFRS